MYKKFKDLLMDKAKKGKYLKDEDAEAKMDVVEQIEEMMGDSMSDKMKGMKKVEVASDSKEGLVKGAKELPKALSKIDELIKAKMKLKRKLMSIVMFPRMVAAALI